MASMLMKFLGIGEEEKPKKKPAPEKLPSTYEKTKEIKGTVQENVRRKRDALRMLDE